MYKIVNIVDLNKAENFIKSDKVIAFSEDRTKMFIDENDYDHKSKAYLSDCIDTVDSAMNSYINAYNNITSTYFTENISDIYLSDGCLIKQSTIDSIMTNDAFLTKEACKELESECISYINELKNKAVSLMVGKLNRSFVKQNSVGKLTFGQRYKNSSQYVDQGTETITNENKSADGYDFEAGEFSLGNLLLQITDINEATGFYDFWKNNYFELSKSFNMKDNGTLYENADELLSSLTDDTTLLFNAHPTISLTTTVTKDTSNFRVNVPTASFDYINHASIPIAQMVKFFLKRQIKTAIKNICDNYITYMTAIPETKENTDTDD